jgi:hypothetical protein
MVWDKDKELALFWFSRNDSRVEMNVREVLDREGNVIQPLCLFTEKPVALRRLAQHPFIDIVSAHRLLHTNAQIR